MIIVIFACISVILCVILTAVVYISLDKMTMLNGQKKPSKAEVNRISAELHLLIIDKPNESGLALGESLVLYDVLGKIARTQMEKESSR